MQVTFQAATHCRRGARRAGRCSAVPIPGPTGPPTAPDRPMASLWRVLVSIRGLFRPQPTVATPIARQRAGSPPSCAPGGRAESGEREIDARIGRRSCCRAAAASQRCAWRDAGSTGVRHACRATNGAIPRLRRHRAAGARLRASPGAAGCHCRLESCAIRPHADPAHAAGADGADPCRPRRMRPARWTPPAPPALSPATGDSMRHHRRSAALSRPGTCRRPPPRRRRHHRDAPGGASRRACRPSTGTGLAPACAHITLQPASSSARSGRCTLRGTSDAPGRAVRHTRRRGRHGGDAQPDRRVVAQR